MTRDGIHGDSDATRDGIATDASCALTRSAGTRPDPTNTGHPYPDPSPRSTGSPPNPSPSPEGEGSFSVGDLVWYEVTTRNGGDFRVPAIVADLRPKRIVVEFEHWTNGRVVYRSVRPYRVSSRAS